MWCSHLLVTSEAATGTAQIWVDDQGANSIVIIPSANALLSVEDVRAAAPTIQGAKVLLVRLP
jgi:ribokinase